MAKNSSPRTVPDVILSSLVVSRTCWFIPHCFSCILRPCLYHVYRLHSQHRQMYFNKLCIASVAMFRGILALNGIFPPNFKLSCGCPVRLLSAEGYGVGNMTGADQAPLPPNHINHPPSQDQPSWWSSPSCSSWLCFSTLHTAGCRHSNLRYPNLSNSYTCWGAAGQCWQ